MNSTSIEIQAAEVLDAAADLLSTPGVWTTNSETLRDGNRHCAYTAICRSSDALGLERTGIASFATGTLGYEVTGNPFAYIRSVAEWNDAQRDRRKVVRALRRTARKLRAGVFAQITAR